MNRWITCSCTITAALLLAACNQGDKAAAPDAAASATPSASATPATAAVDANGDALVPGTEYHATTNLICAINGTQIAAGCPAGVKRGWGDDGGALIEITKPDGSMRAIFTDAAGTPTGADSAEADGSAGWTMVITPRGEVSVVDFGPEHYEIPQALVLGG